MININTEYIVGTKYIKLKIENICFKLKLLTIFDVNKSNSY